MKLNKLDSFEDFDMQLDTPLAQDEQVLYQYNFSYSLIFFFLKSHFWITNKRMIVNSPNLLLIIPVGNDTVTYPLRSIGGVKTRTQFKFGQLFMGIILLIIGLAMIRSIGFLLLVLGILLAIGAFQTVIAIVSAGSGAVTYSHVPWEATVAKKMINELNQLIANI
jgi:hypothetical protein